ncbi:hypothetical protein [Paenibacillus sinensis]|uniref:hypothetical protein n=1 Tax=Paenibacillus sinensis TaxID=2834413 RepID=UPI001CAA3620|nr:hypothetical protein [Paenibacillus sinensis]
MEAISLLKSGLYSLAGLPDSGRLERARESFQLVFFRTLEIMESLYYYKFVAHPGMDAVHDPQNAIITYILR